MANSRKSPETWIAAGLKTLPKTGPDGLRAETLARQINTTKGSFYWHFKDVPSFQNELLQTWADQAKTLYDGTMEREATSVTKLRALAQVRPKPVDVAVRGWATFDPTARKAVNRVDRHIISQLTALLNDLEATHPDFPGLVHTAMVAAPKSGTHAETLVDLLLVLK